MNRSALDTSRGEGCRWGEMGFMSRVTRLLAKWNHPWNVVQAILAHLSPARPSHSGMS